MTAFLQCFWILPQIGFASFGNLMSSFGKAYDPLCTEVSGATLIYLQNSQKLESGFHIFQIPDPRKSILGPGDVFACFACPKIH